MFGINIPPAWDISENDTTPEEVYLNRRKFLLNIGKLGVNAMVLYMLPNFMSLNKVFATNSTSAEMKSQSENNFMDLQGRITSETLVSRYNNF